jgi:hypothetical protein
MSSAFAGKTVSRTDSLPRRQARLVDRGGVRRGDRGRSMVRSLLSPPPRGRAESSV